MLGRCSPRRACVVAAPSIRSGPTGTAVTAQGRTPSVRRSARPAPESCDVLMETAGAWAAVDLGASGGRVLVGRLAGEHLDLDVVHRFAYAPRVRDGRLRWD